MNNKKNESYKAQIQELKNTVNNVIIETAMLNKKKSLEKENTTESNNIKKGRLSTEARKEQFIKQLRENLGFINKTCEQIGINRTTYYRWIEKDKNFAARVNNINDFVIELVEGELLKQIRSGNVTATIFYLVNRGNGKWINIQKVEHNAPEIENKVDTLIKEVREAFKK